MIQTLLRRIVVPIATIIIVWMILPHPVQKLFFPPTKELHILFIGNSYTYFNNMPGMLENIAYSDPGNDTTYVIKSVTRGGASLKDLWNSGEALEALRKQHWDYVVLQQQSMWAMFPETINESYASIKQWNHAIIAAAARPILFETWMRQPGSGWYSDEEKEPIFISPEKMYSRIHSNTNALAHKIGIAVLPIGDYWHYALAVYPSLGLYIKDGSHPSPAGSYFTALLFYRYFSQRSLDHVDYVPINVRNDLAITVKMLASRQTEQ